MAITIEQPLPSNPFGTGFLLRATTDFIGPLPAETAWQIAIRPAAGEEPIVASTVVFSQNPFVNVVMGQQQDGRVQVPVNDDRLTQGMPARLTIDINTNSGIIDSTSIPIVYEAQTGQGFAIQSQLPTTTQGFTEADRQTANYTMAYAAFPLGTWLPIISEVFQNLATIPYQYELIEPIREGSGVLTRPRFGKNVFATGIRFQVMYKPLGIGIDEGAPDSFEIDVLELGLTSDSPGTPDELVESRWYRDQTGVWRWRFDFPHEVLYYIAPGCGVRFWWVILPGPLAGALEAPEAPAGP